MLRVKLMLNALKKVEITKMSPSEDLKIYRQTTHWIAAEKPSGLFTHPTDLDRKAPDLLTVLQAQIKEKLAPLNRLDRGTSGLIIFTKNALATKELQAQWSLETTRKSYLCLARGQTAQSFHSERPLTDRKTGVLKEACTYFERIQQYSFFTFLNARIENGRTHQIRRHLAHLGHHILGDTTYGKGRVNTWARENGLRRMFLHCHELEFLDPFTNENIFLQSSLPIELQNFLEKIDRGPKEMSQDLTGSSITKTVSSESRSK